MRSFEQVSRLMDNWVRALHTKKCITCMQIALPPKVHKLGVNMLGRWRLWTRGKHKLVHITRVVHLLKSPREDVHGRDQCWNSKVAPFAPRMKRELGTCLLIPRNNVMLWMIYNCLAWLTTAVIDDNLLCSSDSSHDRKTTQLWTMHQYVEIDTSL